MRQILLRAPVALMMAGVAAGCADAPTVAAPEAPSRSTTSYISVNVHCQPTFGTYYGEEWDCTAVAKGGSGTGYDFTWTGATETYHNNGYSIALAPCDPSIVPPGWIANITVHVTVTDSNGQIGAGYDDVQCPLW